MSILTPAEEADMWLTGLNAVADSCAIKPAVQVTDGTVGNKKTWPAISATVVCMVLDGNGLPGVASAWDNASLPNSRTVVVPRRTAVAEGAHIVSTREGKTFEVLEYRRAATEGAYDYLQVAEVTT